MKSQPLAAVDVWRPVMEAAGYRCQCTGSCGNEHAKTGGRCPREHDAYTSKHGHLIRLMAAPADPLTPQAKAVALPVGELRAWCPECHTAAADAPTARDRSTTRPPCSISDPEGVQA